MLNCTDVACILHHHHDDDLQHHLQDDRAHHEHQIQIMSGDATDEVKIVIQSILNGTTDGETQLTHVDAPSDSVYMVGGVLIAMLLVAVIIVLLAFTISKLRKREEHAGTVTTNHNNNVIQTSETTTVVVTAPPPPPPPAPTEPQLPPPFFWRYSSSTNSSQYSMCNNDQSNLVHTLPCEEVSECKGFRKNLRGKWKRLVKKKPQPEVYTIPAELREQLKQIYVY